MVAGAAEMVTSPVRCEEFALLLESVAADRATPSVIHCSAGKDRTGWAAASLLMLLGVSDDDVMHDYLLTNEELMPVMQTVLDKFAAAGGDPDLLLPVVGVEADYLDAALDEMRSKYGTVEDYFTRALGIDAAAQQSLRDALVES